MVTQHDLLSHEEFYSCNSFKYIELILSPINTAFTTGTIQKISFANSKLS